RRMSLQGGMLLQLAPRDFYISPLVLKVLMVLKKLRQHAHHPPRSFNSLVSSHQSERGVRVRQQVFPTQPTGRLNGRGRDCSPPVLAGTDRRGDVQGGRDAGAGP